MKNTKKYITTFLFNVLFCNIALFSQPIDLLEVEKNVKQWLDISEVSLTELQGGFTNISFLGTNKDNQFVVRLGKKDAQIFGIDRFCETACQESAHEAGIAPKVLYSDPECGMLIWSFVPGKTLDPKTILDPIMIKRAIEVIKKCHNIPFKDGLRTITIYQRMRNMLLQVQAFNDDFISKEQAKEIEKIVDRIEKYFDKNGKKYEGLCHGDIFPPNFIDDGTKLWLIDWEYAGWGNILFDLASLCIELDLPQQETIDVLKLYFGPTWQDNYFDFNIMSIIFNLNAAFWYKLRGEEVESIGGVKMSDYAQKFLNLFYEGVEKSFPEISW